MNEIFDYLLVFDNARERLVSLTRFTDPEVALTAYAAAEDAAGGNYDLEVVLLGSDSVDTLRRTHGNYFAEEPGATPLALMRFGITS